MGDMAGDDAGSANAAVQRPVRLLEPMTRLDGTRAPARKRYAILSLPTRERMERFTEAKRRSAGVRAVSEAHRFVHRCVSLLRHRTSASTRMASEEGRSATEAVLHNVQGHGDRGLELATEMHFRRAIRATQEGFVLAMERNDVEEAQGMRNAMRRLVGLAAAGAPALGDRGSRLGEAARQFSDQMTVALDRAPAPGLNRLPESQG